jgi:ABC-type cobalt transport system substrate-binding protein
MVLWGIDMQVTDKMIKAALEPWFGEPVTEPYEEHVDNMRFAIQAAIQAAWVKFDINDKSTHPQNLQHVIVLYHTGAVGSDKWSILKTWMFTGCKECVTHWMPLPEFKEHS